jgi:hypothetical protein
MICAKDEGKTLCAHINAIAEHKNNKDGANRAVGCENIVLGVFIV